MGRVMSSDAAPEVRRQDREGLPHLNTDLNEVLQVWDRLEWRHHGAGMLQAYLPHEDPDYWDVVARQVPRRVHIWHRSLLVPGIVEGGAKHNHRFHLRSLVVHGTLLNTVLVPVSDAEGDYQLWRIEGASNRAQAVLVPEDRVRVVEYGTTVYNAGDSYALLKWDYHWGRQTSSGTSMAITLVDIVDKEGGPGAPRKGTGKWARLLCPYGVQPVHAFEDQMSNEAERARDMLQLVTEAHQILLRRQ